MSLGIRAGLCLALLASSSPAFAVNANDFLPGAKAFGMGFSNTAVADDPFALWQNPAATANTPYTQAGGSLARLHSPRGTMTAAAGAYVRPYEPINTATVGAGYYLGRQVDGLDRDEFLVHYAQEKKAPSLFALTKPMRLGANFKILNQQGRGGEGFAFGFDGSAQFRSNFGLTGSAGLRNLTINSKISPVLSLAAAYTHQKFLTFALDMRVRRHLTEFYPGIEMLFHQGLLAARVGRGFQLDGVRQVAFGLGMNFSPVVLDVGATLPMSRAAVGGAFQFSLTYKFGAPSFSGSFVGAAAAQAEKLRSDIETLKDREASADARAKAADIKREIAEGELRVTEQRVREAQDQFRASQKRASTAGYEAEAAELRAEAARVPPPAPPMIRKPAPRQETGPMWPRKHEVAEGDTLRTLAGKYYGDPNLWEKIYEANRDKIDRGLPQAGATFTIPDPAR
jgi:hypothetical protein